MLRCVTLYVEERALSQQHPVQVNVAHLDVLLGALQQGQGGELVGEGHVLSQHLEAVTQLGTPGGGRGRGITIPLKYTLAVTSTI